MIWIPKLEPWFSVIVDYILFAELIQCVVHSIEKILANDESFTYFLLNALQRYPFKSKNTCPTLANLGVLRLSFKAYAHMNFIHLTLRDVNILK
jgi:hypothetical protein